MDAMATMRSGTRTMLLAAAMLAGCALPARAQERALPFSPGETCVYRGSNVLGRIGTGTMAVEPADAGTVLLRFDFRGRVGPAAIEDRSRSWFDTAARGSRRFTKRERSPVACAMRTCGWTWPHAAGPKPPEAAAP